MLYFLRQVLAIALLPVMAAVVLPRLLLLKYGGLATSLDGLFTVLGALFILCGLALFTWCVSLFAQVGHGTLAPWDPTRALVAVGPYRYVRNPMISAVAAVLLGEALFFRSPAVGLWFLAFVAINHAYFVFSEEPGLEARFGALYREYKARVPRWLPKFKPPNAGAG